MRHKRVLVLAVLRRPVEPVLPAAIAVVHERGALLELPFAERLIGGIESRSNRSEIETRQPTIRRANTSITNVKYTKPTTSRRT